MSTISQAFEALGLSESASVDEVKGAWRNLASELHPDHGGDPVDFQELQENYKTALAHAEAPKICPECDGKGTIKIKSGFHSIPTECQNCGGEGYV